MTDKPILPFSGAELEQLRRGWYTLAMDDWWPRLIAVAEDHARATKGIDFVLAQLEKVTASRRSDTPASEAAPAPMVDEAEIDKKDLRIESYRVGGPGGQHTNGTDPAMRITHLPTGIVVLCRSELYQHKNKALALQILRARLYDIVRRRGLYGFLRTIPARSVQFCIVSSDRSTDEGGRESERNEIEGERSPR